MLKFLKVLFEGIGFAGDRYEGEWEDGLENGAGAFIAVDGSTFKGQWCDGQMHGEGVCLKCLFINSISFDSWKRSYTQGFIEINLFVILGATTCTSPYEKNIRISQIQS